MTFTSPFTGDVIVPTDVSYQEISLTTNKTLVWPTFATGSDLYASRIIDVTANAAGRTLKMPAADQVSVGTDCLLNNFGANSFNVLDNDGGVICTVASGEAQYIYITDNTSAAGSWGIIAFGSTTTTSNASVLAGLGLVAISTTLNQSHPASSFVNGYTFVANDRSQTKIWASGSGSVTLPDAATIGNNWFFLLKNNGTGTLTLACSGANIIDGSSTKNFAPDESAFVISTGTEFVTIGYGQSANFVFTALVKPVITGTYLLTPSEASNTIQEYVGSLTGNVIAQYPPAVNLYVISNQTVDNGYSLTITTGVVGGTNAVVPPGQQVTLICDGTNFLNANTVQAGATSISLINGTVGTPALNFGAETSTGIYRPGAGQMNIAVLGANLVEFTSTGMNVNGTGNFENGIAGGVFT
jgi:hypothetical protein